MNPAVGNSNAVVSFNVPRPEDAAIRTALAASLPHLASTPVEPLGEGWAFWAYRAGDTVLRFPKYPAVTKTLAAEAAVMREMAPVLPLPVAAITLHEGGPNGLPFTSHRFVPGVSVKDLQRPLARTAGAALGSFIRAMHAFPVARARELGLHFESPSERRDGRRRLLEDEVVPRVFPLIAWAARDSIRARFETYLGNDAHFDYTPVVSHGDLDDWNTLADPKTGEFTGLADWGDLEITDPAGDFTVSLFGGFANRGISVPDLIEAYGITRTELERMRPRCAFSAFCWPIWEVLYALDTRNDEMLERALAFLHETIARDDL
jgi:aminoglycoside phosphotransferase (APT) family kinase protein